MHAEPSHWLHEISISKNYSSPFLAWANTPIINWGYLYFIGIYKEGNFGGGEGIKGKGRERRTYVKQASQPSGDFLSLYGLEQAGGGVLLLMTQVARVIINQKSRGSDNERIVSPKKKLSPKNCFHMWNSPTPSNKEGVCVCVCVCVRHVKKDRELDG